MYSTDKRTIKDWLNDIRLRRLVLPRFQRMEAWDRKQVRELIQSVVDELPIGSILLLKVGDEPQFKHRPLEGAPEKGESVQEMILDGQQRLTALWRGLTDDYVNETDGKPFRLFLQVEPDDDTDKEEIPLVQTTTFYYKNGKRYPLWPKDPESVYDRGLIPLHLLHPETGVREVRDWSEEACPDNPDSPLENIIELQDIFKSYLIPYIALGSNAPPEAILNTFTKMNTQGTPLSSFDLVVARMEAHDIDMHSRARDFRSEVPALAHFDRIDDLDLLRSVVLLDDTIPTKSKILRIEPDHLLDVWDPLIEGCRSAISFIQQEGVLDEKRLPVERILPSLFALWTYLPEGKQEGAGRRLLRKYLWRSFYSTRYERGGMTPLIQDFRALREILREERAADYEASEVPCFDPEEAEIPEESAFLIEERSPKNRRRLARAILCTTLRGGAIDLHNGRPIGPDNVKQREYHHLFPRKYLKEQGIPDDDETPHDSALNFALITKKTNRSISAKNPEQYLREITKFQGGEKELRRLLRSHLIPVDPFLEEDYHTFLLERAALVYGGMEELIHGNPWVPQEEQV